MEQKKELRKTVEQVLMDWFQHDLEENYTHKDREGIVETIIDTVSEDLQVHVVVELYGMILEDLTVWTDKEKAMEHAKELCEEYECKPTEDCSEKLFFAKDDKEENEIHVWFDLSLNPRKTTESQSA